MIKSSQAQLPAELLPGVRQIPLFKNSDQRGSLCELYRQEWFEGQSPVVQWNAIESVKATLRGVQIHAKRTDYLILLQGQATLWLKDLRGKPDSFGKTCSLRLDALNPVMVTIPAGVAHGILFHQDSLHLVGITDYWDTADELGCFWQDPELGISWGVDSAIVSDRDLKLPPLKALIAQLETLSKT